MATRKPKGPPKPTAGEARVLREIMSRPRPERSKATPIPASQVNAEKKRTAAKTADARAPRDTSAEEAARVAAGMPAKPSAAPKPTRAGKSGPVAEGAIKRTPTARKTQRERIAKADANKVAPVAPQDALTALAKPAPALGPLVSEKTGRARPGNARDRRLHIEKTGEAALANMRTANQVKFAEDSALRGLDDSEQKEQDRAYFRNTVTSVDPVGEDSPSRIKPIVMGTPGYPAYIAQRQREGNSVLSKYPAMRGEMIATLHRLADAVGNSGEALAPKHTSEQWRNTMYDYLQSAHASHDIASQRAYNNDPLGAAQALRESQDTLNSMYHHVKSTIGGKHLTSNATISGESGNSILSHITSHNSQIAQLLSKSNDSDNPLNFDRTRLEDESKLIPGTKLRRADNPGDVRERPVYRQGRAMHVHSLVLTAANQSLGHTISGPAGVHAHQALSASHDFVNAVDTGKKSEIKRAGTVLNKHLDNLVTATANHLNTMRTPGAQTILGNMQKNIDAARSGIDLYTQGEQ